MFDSVVFNVVIGLIFIYLLYSLLVTTINEGIASIFNLRAKKLETGITRMLQDTQMYHPNIWSYFKVAFEKIEKFLVTIKTFFFTVKEVANNNKTLVTQFYNQPGIKYLGENKISNKPSYISPEFFSKALIDTLKDNSNSKDTKDSKNLNLDQIQSGINAITESDDTKKFIQSLLTDANNDIDKFKELIEQWFNETMTRTSSWYKKQTQKMTFLIGFIIALSFNVDTIGIVKNLSNNPKTAETLSNMAVKYAETHKNSEGKLIQKDIDSTTAIFNEARRQVNDEIKSTNTIIGIGWDIPSGTIFQKVSFLVQKAFSSWRSLIGYVLTALAISLGAPFWFDLLNKIIQLRESKKPEDVTTKKRN